MTPLKKILALAVLCLSFSAFAVAQDKTSSALKIDGDVVQVVKGFPITVTAPKLKNTSYVWYWPDSVKAAKKRNVLTITSAPKGQTRIDVTWVTTDFDKKEVIENSDSITLNVGDVPGPGPGPKPPPDPTPTPPDAESPIKAPGFRVLMVYDKKAKGKLPEGQKDVLDGKQVFDFLSEKCVRDADNPQGAFRTWASDVNVSGSTKPWQDAMARPRKSLPWIIVSNHPKGGYEGPLPDDADKAVELMKKYLSLSSPKTGTNKKGGK